MPGRPKTRQGRYININLDVREDLLSWIDSQSGSRRAVLEAVLTKARKEDMSVTIQIVRNSANDGLWNECSHSYEATGSDGRNYTIDGDTFAEDLKGYQQTYREEQSLSEDAAYDKAREELLSFLWTPDMAGVYPVEE